MSTKHKEALYFILHITAIIVVVVVVSFIFRTIENKISFAPQIAFAQETYRTTRLAQDPADSIELNSGERKKITIVVKNSGELFWGTDQFGGTYLATASGKKSAFYDPESWFANDTPIKINRTIYQGEEIEFSFFVKAPETGGMIWERFHLVSNGQEVAKSTFEIGVQIKNVPAIPPTITPPLPQQSSTQPLQTKEFWQAISPDTTAVKNYRFDSEPNIKVGILFRENTDKKDLPLKIRSNNSLPFWLTINGELKLRVSGSDALGIDFDFKNNRYLVSQNNSLLLTTDQPLDLISNDSENIFEIVNLQNGPFWGVKVNDNLFRGKLRVQYNPATQRLWFINELPFEYYVRGIAEVPESYPIETIKAQKIAARTYAFFRFFTPKYTNTEDNESIFTVRSTQADQVYRGLKWEQRSPKNNQASDETRGIVATYDSQPILAYYFAQSNGATRDSVSAVMTKDPVPYLISRPDPPAEGKKRIGHGVGMPQQGAKVAGEQGANFAQILKYYYNDIEIQRWYE
ncbi:MAG: SpoIID/LytB domain-containing protein [Parcubacteria group bacterium]|nr:SpoIID/LytB domain-containing protein [Parcubacteria group bacterium]